MTKVKGMICLSCEKEVAMSDNDCCRECEEMYQLLEYKQNEAN